MRKRYLFLDGLRGLAAVAVMLFHLGVATGHPGLMAHGYLAVDFFFCLSGFVLAHAYRAELGGRLSLGAFMRLRVIRLWPLIAASILAGGALFAVKAIAHSGQTLPWGELTLYVAAGLLLIPRLWPGSAMIADRAYPLNVPLWTLFFELVANLVWAALAPRLTLRGLAIGTAIAAVVLALVCAKFGSLAIGASPETFWTGVPRVAFSFAAGLTCHALVQRGLKVRAPAPLLVAGLLVALAAPILPLNGLADWLAVVVLFPLMVLAGATIELKGALARSLARWSGDLSYPLYALHAPVIALAGGAATLTGLELATVPLMASTAVAAAAAAALAFVAYDRPLRRRLLS